MCMSYISIHAGGSRKSACGCLEQDTVSGSGAYTSIQLDILIANLALARANLALAGSQRYNFDDWNRWREADGMLCRTNADCWADPHMHCQDYELTFKPSADWFNNQSVQIVGECACPDRMFFNDSEVECQREWPLFLILVICIPILTICCCCCCYFKC